MKLYIAILLFALSAFANDTIRVVVNQSPPFVMKNADGEYEGYDIELWEKIATKMKVETQYIEVVDFADIFKYVDEGKADIAISSISVTADRMEKFTFSYPYKASGIGAMVRSENKTSILSTLSLAFGDTFIAVWIWFIIFVIVMTHLIWGVERISDILTKDTRPDIFNDKYRIGIWEALWYFMVTITTVGYGDKVPKHVLTRIISGVSLIVGIAFAGVAISQLSATMQVQQQKYSINSLEDVAGKKVAFITGTTSEGVAEKYKAKGIKAIDIDNAYEMLMTKKVDVVLFDEPSLKYLATSHNDVVVIKDICNPQSYGIMMKKTSYTNKINVSILKLMKNGFIEELDTKYFGK